jgi:transcriptional regulator with XRE-family HTH domain
MDLSENHSTSVSIDGEAIRRIREMKRLTQLYVSKVVGVTTDTVSRWENNRYPTIRRDNAIKLAEALEVDLEEILKQDEEIDESPVVINVNPAKSTRWVYYVVSVAVLLIIVVLLMNNGKSQAPQMQAERILPVHAAPGSRLLVRVHLSSEKQLKGMILRVTFPVGWKLIASEPPASGLDNEEGRARWIFRKPKLDSSVFYLLEVASDAEIGQTVQLEGELIANPDGQGAAIPVKSRNAMQVQPFHWADTNGDGIIGDLEILEVSNLLDDTGQLHLDWDRIEKFWDSGGYRWSPDSAEFVPLREAPPASAQ